MSWLQCLQPQGVARLLPWATLTTIRVGSSETLHLEPTIGQCRQLIQATWAQPLLKLVILRSPKTAHSVEVAAQQHNASDAFQNPEAIERSPLRHLKASIQRRQLLIDGTLIHTQIFLKRRQTLMA